MAARSKQRLKAASTVVIVNSAIALILVIGQLILGYRQIAHPPAGEGPLFTPSDYLLLVYVRLVLVAVQLATGVVVRRRGYRARWLVLAVWWFNAATCLVMVLGGSRYQTVASVAGGLVWVLLGGLVTQESDWNR